MVYHKIEEFREHIEEYGKGSLHKNERYQVYVKGLANTSICASYLIDGNDYLILVDSQNRIITIVHYEDIEKIFVASADFWDMDISYIVYLKEGE
jgi:hypothetical protein